jgi:hypothetical protein
VDEHDPEKKKIVLVMDNLNTHKASSLYAAFKPEEARRIAERLEILYTPKHGNGLDRAEIVVASWLDIALTDVYRIKSR